jgi:DnaK suppressor protein
MISSALRVGMDIIDRAQQTDREIQKALDDYLKRRRVEVFEPPERVKVVNGVAYCVDCGFDIPPKRLEAKPDAVRCVECEARKERR